MRLQTMKLSALALGALISAAGFAGDASAAGTLDKIRKDQTIRIAYREDAPPFSFKGPDGQPAGFIVELCRAAAADIGKQLNIPNLKIAYVQVTAANRLETIQKGKADVLCEATSATLSRRKTVDFSLSTFVDGASLMIRPDGPRNLKDLAGRKVGVLAGTTTEQGLRNTLTRSSINAEVVPLTSHDEAVKALTDDKISAYFADRSILQSLFMKSAVAANLQLADEYLTIEPYALALPRGDEDFRLAVDTALSHIYRSGAIVPIFQHAFGANAVPSPMLQTLFAITGLPD